MNALVKLTTKVRNFLLGSPLLIQEQQMMALRRQLGMPNFPILYSPKYKPLRRLS